MLILNFFFFLVIGSKLKKTTKKKPRKTEKEVKELMKLTLNGRENKKLN